MTRFTHRISRWFGFLDELEKRPSFFSWRFSLRGTAVRLFFTCWLVYALHFATNTIREIYPALSLGDHLSFDVSEYLGLHSDIFEMPERGAFINNNPGASILGAIPYALARPLIDPVVDLVQAQRAANPETDAADYDTIYPLAQEFLREARARGFDVKFGLGAAVMQMGLMAPMSALSVVVMFVLMVSLTHSTKKGLGLALLYAFATPVFYRTAQLNHNLLQAHFALFSLALLWRPWDEEEQGKPLWLLAGFLAGYTVVLDYSGLILAGGLGLYAIFRWRALPASTRRQSDIPRFVLGGILSVSILLAYQWAAFGHPIFPAQNYMPETRLSPQGYNGMDWPRLDLLLTNAFGLRFGLFVASPLLLLALYPPLWFRGRWLGRRERWFGLLLTVAFFLFTAANQFSLLQFNSGVRHMVPVVPFLFLLAAGEWARWSGRWGLAAGTAVIYWSWCQAMYRDVEQGIGIPDALIRITLEGFQLPWLETIERMGFVGETTAVPLLFLTALILWFIWAEKKTDRYKGKLEY